MSDEQNIYPTNDCFTDSLELFNELLRAALKRGIDARPELRLVHAVCAFPTGEYFAHAWIEDSLKDQAMFYGVLNGQRQVFAAETIAEYRAHQNVLEAVSYTYEQAIAENQRCGHYGPWKEYIRQHCSDQKRVIFPGADSVSNGNR